MSDLAIVGTTASGKSSLALRLASELGDVEIVSVDSMQVYRGMDIGTAKPTPSERRDVPHHMIDTADPSAEVGLADFAASARRIVDEIHGRGNRALYVGGTGMYFQCVVDGFELPGQFPEIRIELEAEPDTTALHDRLREVDPVAASRMEPTNRRRVLRALEVTLGSGSPFSSFGPGVNEFPQTDVTILGVWLPRALNAQRIEQRIDEMLARGWVDEVSRLNEGGLSKTAAQALGYGQLREVLADKWTLDEARVDIVARTRAFSRRQRMWFRRDPRINWHATSEDPSRLWAAMLKDCVGSAPAGGDTP